MNIQPGSNRIRFGEVYELRFQREDTGRKLRGHPRKAINLHQFALHDQKPEESLAAYLNQNRLAARIFSDERNAPTLLRYKDAGKPIEETMIKRRLIVVTDALKEKSLSKMRQILDETKGQGALATIRRYVKEKMFPAKLPVVTIRYTFDKPTAEEHERLPNQSGKEMMRWTNQSEVLAQLQTDQIEKPENNPWDGKPWTAQK